MFKLKLLFVMLLSAPILVVAQFNDSESGITVTPSGGDAISATLSGSTFSVEVPNDTDSFSMEVSLDDDWRITDCQRSGTSIITVLLDCTMASGFTGDSADIAINIGDGNDDVAYAMTVTRAAALGINDFESGRKEVTLSPNPSSDAIRLSGLTGEQAYRIYNTLGVEVQSGTTAPNAQRIASGVWQRAYTF